MGKTALDGKRLNAFLMNPGDLTIVGRDTKDGKDHPLWDERAKFPFDEAMVRNIRRYGVVEPVIVRKNGPTTEVVDGRQRVINAREASRRNIEEGLPPVLVPCMLRKGTNVDMLGVMISLNEVRRDDDPLIRAAKAQRMLSYGATEADVAEAFGVSKEQTKNILAILDLDEGVQDLIKGQQLSFTAAIQLRDLKREDQLAKAHEMIASGAVGVTEARRQMRARKAGKPETGNRGRAVSVALLRKIAENEEFLSAISADARSMLLWILGDENHARRIKGLTALLREE